MTLGDISLYDTSVTFLWDFFKKRNLLKVMSYTHDILTPHFASYIAVFPVKFSTSKYNGIHAHRNTKHKPFMKTKANYYIINTQYSDVIKKKAIENWKNIKKSMTVLTDHFQDTNIIT